MTNSTPKHSFTKFLVTSSTRKLVISSTRKLVNSQSLFPYTLHYSWFIKRVSAIFSYFVPGLP